MWCSAGAQQEGADVLGGRVVVSSAGTLSTRSRGGRPSAFNRVTLEDDAIHVEHYRWDATRRLFKRSDSYTFPNPRVRLQEPVAVG